MKKSHKEIHFSEEDAKALLKNASPEMKEYIRHLRYRIRNLSDIGLALSREKNMNKLLEMILLESKLIANADGGTLYMIDKDTLRFEILMTDSLNFHMGGTAHQAPSFPPLGLYTESGKPNNTMIAVHVALTGETINIPDAYKAEGFDFSGTKKFDKTTGYRSKSFLTVPLKNHEEEIIGVLQLINAQDAGTGEIVPFGPNVQDLVEALSSQAAVAITNKNLIKDLENLFESFIKVIAGSIDAKSPYTGGHCQRVPVITMLLADAVNKSTQTPFKKIKLTEMEMYELKIAAWLHDAGKVATPEHVVDKARKLETIYDRINNIATRFEILKRDREIEYLKRINELEADRTLTEKARQREKKKAEKVFKEKTKTYDADLAFLSEVNYGSEFMSAEKIEKVKRVGSYKWSDNGVKKDFLTKEETESLCIKHGTLSEEERKIVKDHVSVTIKMLEQLPYPRHLLNVCEYAGAHHEKMDGTGYPRGLTKENMSVQARIMVIADIFEALTACDRPYKKGKTLNEAMQILKKMKDDGHIDSDLFDVFVKEKIYLKYAKKYLLKAQIDTILL